MKIAITRKDGQMFYAHGSYAADLHRHYSEGHLSQPVELEGETFKIGDIRYLKDLDFTAAKSETKSCGQCKDGWVVTDKARPCQCALGDAKEAYVADYKHKLSQIRGNA